MKNLMGILLAGLVCPNILSAQGEAGFPPAQVAVVKAEVRNMAPTVDLPGTVVSLNDAMIAAEVEGPIIALANVGDAVNKGQVIAEIDPRLMHVAVTRARANVKRLESDLEYREKLLKRNEGLAQTNNASATLLDESRALRDAAIHQLDDARAQLVRAEGDLERSNIKAPFAGHIADRMAAVGEYVNVGEDVLRLVDTQRKEISVPMPIRLTSNVAAGMAVDIAGSDKPQNIRAVVPVGNQQSRMVELRLAADNDQWLVGSPVQVQIPAAPAKQAVVVPRDALVQRGGQSFVYRIGPDSTAEQIALEEVAAVGLWVAMPPAISAGDSIVIRGAERLQPGQAVAIQGSD